MADGSVPIVLSPEPFARSTTYAEAPAGCTVRSAIADAVRAGSLSLDDLKRTSVYVDGERLDRDKALDHVLAEGQIVNVVVEPLGGGGGGNKDIGQILLTIAVIAVSAWVGGGGLGLTSAFWTKVAAASVMVAGQAAIGALYAPDSASQARANDRYALQSASNQFRQWGPMPLALGEVVAAPDLVAKTFTQNVGDESWIYGILGLHYGPCTVEELKIGDTLVSSMGSADVRIAQHLTPGPRTFTIVPNDIDQLDLQEELTATTGSATPVVRAASAEGEKFEFDFYLPMGLYYAKDDGRKVAAQVTATVRYRPVDANGNPTGSGSWSSGLTVPLNAATNEPMRVMRSLSLPLGRYQFEVRRSVRQDNNAKRKDDIYWTAVRAVAFRKPVADETLSIIEFAVRATALNQGTLAPITCRITPVCPTWTGAQWGPAVPTSNPAALVRWLMTGPAPALPLTALQADQGLRAWSALCDQYNWESHIYLTDDRKQDVVLGMLGRAGRAGIFWDGTQLVAAPWVEKPAPRQLFAGGNLKDHRWTNVYPDEVHALRVEFLNIDQAGEPDELYVYADGYAETAGGGKQAATLIEALRIDGQMTLERAYREGRWTLGQRIHQRRIDTWSTDVEHVVSRFGDRVRLAWDRVNGTDCRVRCRRWSGSLVSGLRLAHPVTMEPGQTYAMDMRLGDRLVAAVPVVNPATTGPIVTREVVFASPRAANVSPVGGDLVAFGTTERLSEDVEIIGIEPGQNLTANITAIRYVAPLLMQGETGPIPPLQSQLTGDRRKDPPMPTLLGVSIDEAGARVGFSMPPWKGSPITGFGARWRAAPASSDLTAWVDLPDLPAGAMILATPPLRDLPAEDNVTRVQVEIRAMTASGRASDPLTVTASMPVVEVPSADVWTVTIRPPDASGAQLPGLTVTGTSIPERVAMVAIGWGLSDEGPWKEAYSGPPVPKGVPLDSLPPGADVWVSIAYFSSQGVPSGFLVLGPFPVPSLIADDAVNLGGFPASELLSRLDGAEAIGEANAAAVEELFDVYGHTASAAAEAAEAAEAAAAAILARSDAIAAKEDAVSAAGASASSASQAGGFKTDAETAAAASMGASVTASTAAASSLGAAIAAMPPTPLADLWTTQGTTGAPSTRTSLPASAIVSGSYVQASIAGPKQHLPWRVGGIFELTSTVYNPNATAVGFRHHVQRFDAAYQALGGSTGPTTQVAAGATAVVTSRFSMGAASPGATTLSAVGATEWLSVNVTNNLTAGSPLQIRNLSVADVTASVNAADAATASAASAANAAASETVAGQKAAAAETSRVQAETARGQAQTAATNAATSETNAAGSASQASTSQQAAANSRDAAAGSADAASGSASTATTKAGEAGTSAAAAFASQVSASTARDRAAESASNASYLDVGAAFTFANTVDGWGAVNGSLSPSPTGALFIPSGTDPQLIRNGLAILGARYTRVIVTLTRTKVRTSGGWDGTLYFSTDSHGISSSFRQTVTRDPALGERTELTWDMPALTNGGADWLTSTIRSIRLDLDNGPGGEFTIHNVRVVGSDTAAPAKSASAAATSASNASASETAAGQSATASAGSATTASTKAGEASTFASQASTSAANANTAAISAGVSATSAASRAGGNIVAMGSFSDGTIGTWTGSVTNVAVSGVPDGSTRALRSTSRDAYEGSLISGVWGGRRLRVSGYGVAPGPYPLKIGIHGQTAANGSHWVTTLASSANTTSWATFSGEIVVPADVNRLRPFIQSEGPQGAPDHHVQVATLRIEDVTESASAANSAAVATSQAASAGASASEASIKANLAAQVGQGAGYHRSPTWLDWSTGPLPPSAQLWGAASTVRDTGSARYGACLAVNSSDGSNSGVELLAGRFVAPGPVTHVVVEYEVLLQGGSFRRSGLQASIQDGGVDRNAIVHLFDEHGVGVAGQTYSGAKLVKLPIAATAPNGMRLYLFNNFSDLSGGSSGGKNLRWQRVNVRAASSAEIETQKVVGLEAQLSITAATTADLATRMATARFEVIAAAGGAPAQLVIRADTSGSVARLVASAISFASVVNGAVVEAMRLIGGEVFFMRPIYIDVGTKRLIVGPGGTWVLWFGGTDKTAAQATRTNGYFAFGTDGVVYHGSAALGGTPFTAIPSEDVVGGTRQGTGMAYTRAVTIGIDGASGPVTYAWQQVSGEETWTITGPSSATTTFGAPVHHTVGQLKRASFICRVTPTATGKAVIVTVGATIFREPDDGGA